jgi:drug/metabolite transporter (DMT)-like permease
MTASVDRRKAIIFLLIAAVLWSTSGIFLKLLNWQPIAVLAARSLFSSLVFLVYLRRIPRRFTRWQWVAAISSVLTQLLYITAIQMTTAANAIFLQYTAPIYIILLGYWFLREKPSRADWVAMLVIFAGLGLFFGDSLSPGGFTGNLLAIISGVTMALMTVAMRAQKDGSPAESFLLANILGMLLGGYFVFQQPWTVTNWAVVTYLGDQGHPGPRNDPDWHARTDPEPGLGLFLSWRNAWADGSYRWIGGAGGGDDQFNCQRES